MAASLGNDPRRIFEFVRNTCEFEPYYSGLVKGADETLLERAGNDFDLATLLVALLRSAGFTARYVRQPIKIPAENVASWVGTTDPHTAGLILQTAGVNTAAVMSGTGKLKAFLIDHVWVEALVRDDDDRDEDWDNDDDDGGKWRRNFRVRRSQKLPKPHNWRSLDPSFKLHRLVKGRNIVGEANANQPNIFDTLLRLSSTSEGAHEVMGLDTEELNFELARRQDRFIAYLDRHAPNLTLEDVIGKKIILPARGFGLHRRPPFHGSRAAPPVRFTDVPDADKQLIRFQTYGIDITLPIAQIAHRKVTLTFAPATSADQAAVDHAGGILRVGPFSVNVKAQLRLDGTVVAEGLGAPVGFHAFLLLDFIQGPFFLGRSQHVVSLGGVYAIALNVQNVPTEKFRQSKQRLHNANAANLPVMSDAFLGEMLYALGQGYMRYNDLMDEYLAGTQNAVYFHQVSEALISFDLLPDFSGPTPHMSMAGYAIDAKRKIIAGFDRAGNPKFNPFALFYTSLMLSSTLEHTFLRTMVGWPGVSTMQFLQEAVQNEIPIFGIGPENIANVLPALSHPPHIIAEIQRAVANGFRVIIPREPMRLNNWTGVGFIELDPRNGTGGMLLSALLNGGSSTLSRTGMTPEAQERVEKRDGGLMEAFLDGLILGDLDKAHYNDKWANRLKIGGKLLSDFVEVGAIRDAGANLGEVIDSGGSQGKVDLILSLIGCIPFIGPVAKGAGQAARIAPQVAEVALKETAEVGANVAKLEAVAPEAAAEIASNLTKTGEAVAPVVEEAIGIVSSASTKSVVNGISVETHVVSDGEKLLKQVGIDIADGSRANRGLAGEVVQDVLQAERGMQPIGNLANKASNVPGLDRAFISPATGNLRVVEVKFIEEGANLTKSKLGSEVGGAIQTQLTDLWLLGAPGKQGAIARSVSNGGLTAAEGAAIEAAARAGTLEREVVMVKNGLGAGGVSTGIGKVPELAGTTVTVIQMPKTLPKP